MLALDKMVNVRPDLAALARSSAGFPFGGALGGGGGGGGYGICYSVGNVIIKVL
jgi:hypothetical protein